MSFERVHRVPSLSADTPGYDPDGGLWLGGVWAPTNYMVLRGLSEHGFDDLPLADRREPLLQRDRVATRRPQAVWEHHAPTGQRPRRAAAAATSWVGPASRRSRCCSSTFSASRYDSRTRRLTWKLRRTEELGVSRYPFGADGSVDLRVEARSERRRRSRASRIRRKPAARGRADLGGGSFSPDKSRT